MLKSLKVCYISYIYYTYISSDLFLTSACSNIGGGIINRKERMWNNEKNTE